MWGYNVSGRLYGFERSLLIGSTKTYLMKAAMMEFKRTFVPQSADPGQWEEIAPLFRELSERSLDSVEALERWLEDCSELEACLSEEQARRYIAMTCQTGDPELEKRYLEFIEKIVPPCKSYSHKLNEKYTACSYRNDLPRQRYGVLDRSIEAEIKRFREENIPLQTEESKLSQRYQKLCGAMTVEFDGQEQTLPQMAKYLEETDRDRRQDAWEGVAKRRLQDCEEIHDVFDELIRLRHEIANHTDLSTFVDYAFLMYKRFDYTPEDCFQFHQAVETCVVPLSRKIATRRRERMKLDRLRPWDMAVDPLGRPPLRPFQTAQEFSDGCKRIYHHLDGELESEFQGMLERKELDLESRKGKAPGGYQYTLDEVRRPFIFMNAAGLQRDVETLLHESGHAFHALACRNDPLLAYRESPIEFAEVASMSMERFGADYLDEFYSNEDAGRAKQKHLEGVIEVLPWIACIDAFQHWIYTHPGHSRRERTEFWQELDGRFGHDLDWSGYETMRENAWQRQIHLFCHPFYYIEYGIAQLGALQLWRRFKEDPNAALTGYRTALTLGGSRPLPELFEAAGIRFDFSLETIEPLMRRVEAELDGG